MAYNYSVKWWFDWSFTKSKVIIWGKDQAPNTPVVFGESKLEVVDKYKYKSPL